jgi:hypothetical protein
MRINTWQFRTDNPVGGKREKRCGDDLHQGFLKRMVEGIIR